MGFRPHVAKKRMGVDCPRDDSDSTGGLGSG